MGYLNKQEGLEDAAAWWLLFGEGEPTTLTRIIGTAPEDLQRREHVSSQISRLIEEAKIAGFGPAFIALLEQLCLRPDKL